MFIKVVQYVFEKFFFISYQSAIDGALAQYGAFHPDIKLICDFQNLNLLDIKTNVFGQFGG